MSHRRLSRALFLCCAIAALSASAAAGALVETGNLVLHADGGFKPRTLPRGHYAPIDFKGHFDIASKDGSRPVALQRAVIYFDRDGRLGVAGLPTCAAELIANASVAEARQLCGGAIVGSGEIDALISFGGSLIPASSALTIFNAPRVEGHPAVVLHAQTTAPATQTFAIVVPIIRHAGEFGYQATIDVPPIAGGLGSLTHLNVEIGRRYESGGKRRSYIAARCSDNILRTRGAFTFADGTLIEGGVEKYCRSE
ncbi:MAG TPA: hypothetical protein VGO24_03095 [Solirubrobacterales bacterium]|nr:hypothetical protein [Solirubrobacterales bacterium]